MGLFQFHSQEPHRLLFFYCGYRWHENFAIICTISCNYGVSIYLIAQEVPVCVLQGRKGRINIDCFQQKVLLVWLTAISG